MFFDINTIGSIFNIDNEQKYKIREKDSKQRIYILFNNNDIFLSFDIIRIFKCLYQCNKYTNIRILYNNWSVLRNINKIIKFT